MKGNALLASRPLLLALFFVLALLLPPVLQGNSITPAVPNATDACPVCGMLVQPHQDWLAQVRLSDGSTLFFEGPKDMFRYLRSPGSYAKDKRDLEIIGGFVTTWSEHRTVPIEKAWFVIGSDVRGPAGQELVAHASIADANKFIIEHGGMRLVRADDVTSDLLAQMP